MTEKLPTGIKRYYNQYRAFAVICGEPVQEYFPDLELAIAWRQRWDGVRRKSVAPGGMNAKKRSNAKSKDLPTGYYEFSQIRENKRIEDTVEHSIGTLIFQNGVKIKQITARYGTMRTRKQALKLVQRKRAEYCRKHGI